MQEKLTVQTQVEHPTPIELSTSLRRVERYTALTGDCHLLARSIRFLSQLLTTLFKISLFPPFGIG